MTKTQSTVTARLDRVTADNLLPALTHALQARGSTVVSLVLDMTTARNLLLALTHSLQAVGAGKKKKKKWK